MSCPKRRASGCATAARAYALACLSATLLRPAAAPTTTAILAFIVLVPVLEFLAQALGRQRETATFALVIAAAGLGGGVAALAVGLVGLATEEWLAPDERERVLTLRLLVFDALVGAGVLVRDAAPLAPALMLLWVAVIMYLLFDRLRQGQSALLPGVLAMSWLTLDLGLAHWLPALPPAWGDFIESTAAGLPFAVGFMSANSLLGSALRLRRDGWSGPRFWRATLLPTFARYNLMAVVGTMLAALLLLPCLTRTTIAFIGLAVLILTLVVRLEGAHAHRRLIATICALSSALDARDPYTRAHSDRVTAYAVGIAEHLGWPVRERRELELAAHSTTSARSACPMPS